MKRNLVFSLLLLAILLAQPGAVRACVCDGIPGENTIGRNDKEGLYELWLDHFSNVVLVYSESYTATKKDKLEYDQVPESGPKPRAELVNRLVVQKVYKGDIRQELLLKMPFSKFHAPGVIATCQQDTPVPIGNYFVLFFNAGPDEDGTYKMNGVHGSCGSRKAYVEHGSDILKWLEEKAGRESRDLKGILDGKVGNTSYSVSPVLKEEKPQKKENWYDALSAECKSKPTYGRAADENTRDQWLRACIARKMILDEQPPKEPTLIAPTEGFENQINDIDLFPYQKDEESSQ